MLSGVMLLGSFIAGSIPIVMTLSEEKVHFVSIVGAGLLVGTALAVIIPEGIHTLILAQHNTPARHHQHSDPFEQSVLKVSSSPSSIAGGVLGVPAKMYDPPHEQGHAHSGESSEAEALSSVGLALVLGFIFMLLVDQCSRSASSSRGGGDLESSSSLSHAKKSFTATLGLVVHAAADGIALGAAATTSHTEVEMIVFFAIMLHKAPAAFGLVTFLLHEGLDRKRIRKHLALFSFAAPVAAIVTYMCISPEGDSGGGGTMHATSMAMLFSAGTFLYVATVHVLPEVTKDSQHGYSRKELFGLVLGAVIPLLLTAGHQH